MQSFTVRKAFLVPLGLLLVLAALLFAVCLAQDEEPVKLFLLGAIILPVLALFLESTFRRAVVDGEGVTVFKLLRQKRLRFADVTAVETVMVRRRVFLTLCAGDDFLILSNAYADFPGLVRALLGRVPGGTVSAETAAMAEAPPVKSTDIVSCWLAVALLALILYVQLGGRF